MPSRFILLCVAALFLLPVVPWQRVPCWALYEITRKPSLEALIRDIRAAEKINALDVGTEGVYRDRRGDVKRYDSYRTLNGDLVSWYPSTQHDASAQYIEDIHAYCARHGISCAQYMRIHRQLKQLGISGFTRGEAGVIHFSIREMRFISMPGDSHYFTLSFVPDATQLKRPYILGREVIPHWFIDNGNGW
jgi:hypothetical protein